MAARWTLLSAILAACLALPVLAEPLACEKREPVAYTTREVEGVGLTASFLAPAAPGRRPGLLVLGGSEGGKADVRRLADPFARQGYAVLALSYFGSEGVPPTLENIPLEYFDKALAWLATHPSVDRDRIGVYGVSKGAEAALLIGSRSPRLRAVAAGMPTHVVWPGVGARGSSSRSSWSSDGKPLAFLPYDTSRAFDVTDWLGSIYRYYDGALAHAPEHPHAFIPVERINGPVLLISGEDDRLWPATRMSNLIIERLNAKKFRFAFDHLAYPNAGHAVGMPPSLGASERGPDEAVGGTATGNAAARADMWPKLVCFLDAALVHQGP